MFCLFISQEELGIFLGLLITGKALERTPSQVQYYYWVEQVEHHQRCYFFTGVCSIFTTGSGRYIPGSGENPTAPVGGSDPFTGELIAMEPDRFWTFNVDKTQTRQTLLWDNKVMRLLGLILLEIKLWHFSQLNWWIKIWVDNTNPCQLNVYNIKNGTSTRKIIFLPGRWRRLLLSSRQADRNQHLFPKDWWCDFWASQCHTDHW